MRILKKQEMRIAQAYLDLQTAGTWIIGSRKLQEVWDHSGYFLKLEDQIKQKSQF